MPTDEGGAAGESDRIEAIELRVFTEPQYGATYEQQLRLALTSERLGFGGYFRSDHYRTMAAGDGLPGPTDAWVTLAGLARETQRIRLGTLVTAATFRLPGPLAIAVAQVDVMSGGRVELGLGSGWFEAEHRAYGIPFPPLSERLQRLEEQLAIVTGLWATPIGERFSYSGQHYELSDSPALPKPSQQQPPVIVGGTGPRRTPRLAARFASEFNMPFSGVGETRAQFDTVRRACEDAGRDPASLALSHAITVCCAADEATLRRRAERTHRPLAQIRADGAAGTPPEVVERLRAYAEAGAERCYVQLIDLDDHDHLELIAAEVMPHLD